LNAAKEKLEIVNACGEAAFARPPHPSRAPRGEGRIPFELSLKYTASKISPILKDYFTTPSGTFEPSWYTHLMSKLVIRQYRPSDKEEAFQLHVRALKNEDAHMYTGKWEKDLKDIPQRK